MIALGSDQGGFELKQEIIKHLKERGLDFKDYGSYDAASVDYPEYAKKVCKAINDGECERGILICGTGIGISITANKIKGISLQTALWQRLQDFITMQMCLHSEEEL